MELFHQEIQPAFGDPQTVIVYVDRGVAAEHPASHHNGSRLFPLLHAVIDGILHQGLKQHPPDGQALAADILAKLHPVLIGKAVFHEFQIGADVVKLILYRRLIRGGAQGIAHEGGELIDHSTALIFGAGQTDGFPVDGI